MDATELRAALEAHSAVLSARGAEIRAFDIDEPATEAELDNLESQLGMQLPPSFREALGVLGKRIDWRWHTDEDFAEPFDGIFSGELAWSINDLPQVHEDYKTWVRECFSNPADPYDAIWHDKLGVIPVANGDQIALELAPEKLGQVVYLSHDDGEGHGYVMADSFADLVARWVPLACPGAECWQWLPFVPYDLGPIDPASADASVWRATLGLHSAAPNVQPSHPNDQLFDALMKEVHADPGDMWSPRKFKRAMRVGSRERAAAVLDALEYGPSWQQYLAAEQLGRWNWQPAVEVLARLAVTGAAEAQLGAISALAAMSGDAVDQAILSVYPQVPEHWRHLLGDQPHRKAPTSAPGERTRREKPRRRWTFRRT